MFEKQALREAPPLLLSPRQAARALSVSEKTLYNYTKSGDIPVVRLGRSVRYSVDDLKQWIQRASERSAETSKATLDVSASIV